ncbi:MAG: hypothetical protein U0X93_02750 [Anaerolineales bacterium]
MSVANELAETVKRTLGLTPQVIINQKIIYKRTNEILQLAMIEQDYDVEYETSDKLLGSEKQIHLRGMYRAKIGFDLQKDSTSKSIAEDSSSRVRSLCNCPAPRSSPSSRWTSRRRLLPV